ncbi:MAG: tRNA pseudouridine(38-40) synthase TruA [Candidatus Izimaplasma sp.]|nr:tRNA pseudouridine(38-40) synthase TruA [Candidatus Izimaplasma bacterium]
MRLIQEFYQALNDKNHSLLLACVDESHFKGNIQHGYMFESLDTFLDYYFQLYGPFIINKITQYGSKNYVSLTLNNETIATKLTIENNKIIHHYHMVDDGKKRIKATLSYNGYSYYGFQKQDTKNTIQEVVETTISQALNDTITIVSSGRTDRKVHANRQVIHFDTTSQMPIEKYRYIINALLPDDIYAFEFMAMPKAFHARFDVVQKEYLYKLSTNPYDATQAHNVWFVEPFDIKKFKEALEDTLGTHDFYPFSKRPQTKNTVRHIDAINIKTTDGMINVTIKAKGFLRHMVRYIIGAAVMIAQNRVDFTIKDVFRENDNEMIKTLANPAGLYLNNVYYGETQ